MRNEGIPTGVRTIAGATAAFAVVHSLLASRAVKEGVARRLLGDRARAGWYRVFFNAQAVATFGALALLGRRLPDRELYDVRGPLRGVLRAGQLGGLLFGAWAAREVGLARMSGVPSLRAWWRGDAVVPPEPEAQGPAPDPRTGRLRTGGPFAVSRHPLNLMPLPVLWLQPRMTANLAAFNVVATFYLALGSRHEERRLRAAHGDAYEAYRRSGVSYYLPGRPVRARRG